MAALLLFSGCGAARVSTVRQRPPSDDLRALLETPGMLSAAVFEFEPAPGLGQLTLLETCEDNSGTHEQIICVYAAQAIPEELPLLVTCSADVDGMTDAVWLTFPGGCRYIALNGSYPALERQFFSPLGSDAREAAAGESVVLFQLAFGPKGEHHSMAPQTGDWEEIHSFKLLLSTSEATP